MIDPNAFTKLMPGLDFMRDMMQSAGQSLPTIGQWVAPTLDPAEIEKRIGDLKAVHFWLEQNARMLGVTIQALEVQRMTLSTLQVMNLPMTSLRKAMTLPKAAAATAQAKPAAAPAPAPTPPAKAEPAEATEATEAADKAAAADTAERDAKPMVDPMLWWGALTRQFAELATKAVQDSSAGLAKNLAAVRDATRAIAEPQAAPAAAKQPTAPKAAARKTAKTGAKRVARKGG